MARYEVTARATSPHGLLLGERRLHNARVRCVTSDGSDRWTVVLRPRSRRGKPDGAWLVAQASVFELGIDPAAISQIDLHRVSRRGTRRTLIRSWSGPADPGPGTAGTREPRKPLPSPPHLHVALPLP